MPAPSFLAFPYSAARAAVAAGCCLLLVACAATPSSDAGRSRGSGGGSSARAQSGGTPVNPFSNPGAADTPTAAATGAQPRQF